MTEPRNRKPTIDELGIAKVNEELFNDIGALDLPPRLYGIAKISGHGSYVRLAQTAWVYDEAKALHEWLGRALASVDTAAK